VDVFEPGYVRITALTDAGLRAVVNQPIKLSPEGQLLEKLPFSEGDSVRITISKTKKGI
jgi:hypothetical protein